jgi:hypothetical protein
MDIPDSGRRDANCSSSSKRGAAVSATAIALPLLGGNGRMLSVAMVAAPQLNHA